MFKRATIWHWSCSYNFCNSHMARFIPGFKTSPPGDILRAPSVSPLPASPPAQTQSAHAYFCGNEIIQSCSTGYMRYVRCLQWIEDKLSLIISRLGEESALRPCRTISICVAIAFICSFGLIRLNIVSRAEKLWVDPLAPSSLNKQWVDQVYGEQVRIIRILVVNDGQDTTASSTAICANTDGTRPNSAPCACGSKMTTCAANTHCFSEHSLCFRNTLSVEAFREMMLLDQRLRQLTGKGNKRFVDFCSKSVLPGSPCLISSPLEIWSAPSLPFGNPGGDVDTKGCVDTPDSQLNLATAGRIRSCSALVAELKDNGVDCSFDLSQVSFRGTPADLCCRACRVAGLSPPPKAKRLQVPDAKPGDCVPTGQLQWSPGPQLQRFEQTVDRCATV